MLLSWRDILVADKSPVTTTCLLASSSCPTNVKIGSVNCPIELWSEEKVVVPLIVLISIPSPFSPELSLINLNLAIPSDESFDLTVNIGSDASTVAELTPLNTPPVNEADPSDIIPSTVKLLIPPIFLLASATSALPAEAVPAVTESTTDKSDSSNDVEPIVILVVAMFVEFNEVAVNVAIPDTDLKLSNTNAFDALAVPSVMPANLSKSAPVEVRPVNLLISVGPAVIATPPTCN